MSCMPLFKQLVVGHLECVKQPKESLLFIYLTKEKFNYFSKCSMI